MKPETPGYVRQLAKEMRRDPTPAEDLLWQHLRRNRVIGCKFYRQYPIGRYIADFCCPDKGLIIELDGKVHESERNTAYDKIRDRTLACEGMTVIRFQNDQVIQDINNIITRIETVLMNSSQQETSRHRE